jgi:hypothetical protein
MYAMMCAIASGVWLILVCSPADVLLFDQKHAPAKVAAEATQHHNQLGLMLQLHAA